MERKIERKKQKRVRERGCFSRIVLIFFLILGCWSVVKVTPARRLLATPTPMSGASGFGMQENQIDKSM